MGCSLHVQFAVSCKLASPNNMFLFYFSYKLVERHCNRRRQKKKSSIALMTFSFFRFSSASHFSQPWTSSRYRRKHFHSSNLSCDWVPHTSRDMEKIIRSLTPGEGEVQQQRAANFTSSQRRLGHVHLLSKKPFRKS